MMTHVMLMSVIVVMVVVGSDDLMTMMHID